MSRLMITSDLHLGHKNICKYREGFSSPEEHNEILFDNLATSINKSDTLYMLGDVAFDKYWLDKVAKIKCKHKKLICGNHDRDHHSMLELCNAFDSVDALLSKRNIWWSHAPIHPQELRGRVLNIHGHCVDEDTEILTKDGWKEYSNLKVGEAIYSMDLTTGAIIDDQIKDIVCKQYSGDVIHIKSKVVDMLYTDEHRVVTKTSNGFRIIEAKELTNKSQLKYPVAGMYNTQGTGLSEYMLKLYICIVADGNITPANLVRFMVSKQRKVDYFKTILTSLGLSYKEGENAAGKWVHFRLPLELFGIKIKGLDKKLLLKATPSECSHIRDAYRNTDGNRNLIFTSKKEEVDLLSTMFTLNNYRTKIHTRTGHGFSSGTSYQLSVTEGDSRVIGKLPDKVRKVKVVDKLMWCPVTASTTWIARRKGSIFITGNCHQKVVGSVHKVLKNGIYNPHIDKQLLEEIVDPDSNYFNVCVEHTDFKPISFVEVMERVS